MMQIGEVVNYLGYLVFGFNFFMDVNVLSQDRERSSLLHKIASGWKYSSKTLAPTRKRWHAKKSLSVFLHV